MEIIRFVFSSFWIWLGVVVLAGLVLQQAVELAKALRPPKKVEAYRIGERWHVKVEGAGRADVRAVMEQAEPKDGDDV